MIFSSQLVNSRVYLETSSFIVKTRVVLNQKPEKVECPLDMTRGEICASHQFHFMDKLSGVSPEIYRHVFFGFLGTMGPLTPPLES